MPNGRVMRIDDEDECVYIAWRGRSYEAARSEVEPSARLPGARVQFKLHRSGGIETAEEVRLRRGTRTNKRQRRFGDLTGARAPGAKVKTSAQQAYGIDVTTQPFRVVGAWLAALGDHDLDGATGLYLPSAVVHGEEGSTTGRARIRSLVERLGWLGVDPETVDLDGLDRYVRAEATSGGESLVSYFSIAEGAIAEQWLGPEPPVETPVETSDIEVILGEGVASSVTGYASEKLDAVVAATGGGARHTQIKLNMVQNPTGPSQGRAEAKFDIDGTVIRAHATGSTMTEVVDLVVGRLRNHLEHHRDRERHKATGLAPAEGSWRHGNLPTVQLAHYDRDVADREVVAHKSFAPEEVTVEEAAWDMSLLDYDFFLFVELTTGRDCLLEQTSAGDLVLHALPTADTTKIPLAETVTWSQLMPSTLRPSEAIPILDGSGQRFVFFQNSTTQRGNVLYRRYDGHYGLITPPVDDE